MYILLKKNNFKKMLKKRNYDFDIYFDEKDLIDKLNEKNIALEYDLKKDIIMKDIKEFLSNILFTGYLYIDIKENIAKISFDINNNNEIHKIAKLI